MFVFIVGFERCGTHTLANVIKQSCEIPCWVEHEPNPTLCYEAHKKSIGKDCKTKEYKYKFDRYKWLNGKFKIVCESNHRLGYFIPELSELDDVKFILCVRDPVETIISRIATLAHWPQVLHLYPEIFTNKINSIIPYGKREFNEYRVMASNHNNDKLYKFYLDELIYNYRTTTSDLLKSNKPYLILKTEEIDKSANEIIKFIANDCFNDNIAKKLSEVKCDTIHNDPNKKELLEYAKQLILPHQKEIYNEFEGIMREITL